MVLIDGIGHDIDRLPAPKKKTRPLYLSLIIDVITVGFFSVCVFTFINYPSMMLIGRYMTDPTGVQYNFPNRNETLAQSVAVEGKKPENAPEIKQYPDNTIFIPKIGVQAPVGWDTPNNQITEALEKKVVHLQGTGKPGGYDGIFITGHSSNYWWKEGDYNSVFALLPQLNEGDEIIITYQGEFHHYKISGKDEVKKDQVVEHLTTGRERLTLMTCVPVGTNLRRLLIYADPIN